jgi:RNA-binding protein
MIDKKKKMRLKSEAQTMKATLQIGKGGITDGVIEEIKTQLKRQELIKVKILKSAFSDELGDREKIAKALSERAGAELIEIKGNTIVLSRKGSKGKER